MAGVVRGEYAGTAQRRRDIIAAAVQVFSENGFRDGSLRDVAERAGMTHAGIRHHFPSKVKLLEAVLAWRDEEALARGGEGRPAGLDLLRVWIGAIQHNTDTPVLVELEMTLSAEAVAPDHPAHDYFREQRMAAIALLERAFVLLQERGELVCGFSPEGAARMVVACTIGLQSMWLLDRSINLHEELRRSVQTLVTVQL
ncbi:hypothetical protein CcI49_37360 [Frankia sp. CcI49]|nr:hypothetical protein CcI49_37360 [Frankia sp. CcI49]